MKYIVWLLQLEVQKKKLKLADWMFFFNAMLFRTVLWVLGECHTHPSVRNITIKWLANHYMIKNK